MDTMPSTPEGFNTEGLKLNRPMAFQPEGGGSLHSMDWETMSTCHCKYTPLRQTVDHYKFLDSRRMTSVRDRWSLDHTDAFQFSFFNGVGFETTENAWGEMTLLTDRNAEALRRINTVMRHFRSGGMLASPAWRPHAPGVLQSRAGVFGSAFPHPSLPAEALWTFVNRNHTAGSTGRQFKPPSWAAAAGGAGGAGGAAALFDCWSGAPLTAGADGAVSFDIEPGGYGCVVRSANDTASTAPGSLGALLSTMRALAARPLASFDPLFYPNQQVMTPYSRAFGTQPQPNTNTSVATPASGATSASGAASAATSAAAASPSAAAPVSSLGAPPAGMVSVPGTAPAGPGFRFTVETVKDQAQQALSTDAQFWWEAKGNAAHGATIPVEPFFIDARPVTCRQWQAYLASSGYAPQDGFNFLKNWDWGAAAPAPAARQGAPLGYETHAPAPAPGSAAAPSLPPALAGTPVVYVSFAEARAFCAHYGKRLPQDWEFQWAGQVDPATGQGDGRGFPWGAAADKCDGAGGGAGSGKQCVPPVVVGRKMPGAAAAGAHSPQGDSRTGAADMAGNVWQFTNEVTDAHSRAALVRGGSNWRPGINGTAGSKWYFQHVTAPMTQHNKYELVSDSYERAGALGFRCVQDVAPSATADPAAAVARAKAAGGGAPAVAGRWGGPPVFNTTLALGGAGGGGGPAGGGRGEMRRERVAGAAAAEVVEWVRWTGVGANGSLDAVVSARPAAEAARIGTPRSVCGGQGAAAESETSQASFGWVGGRDAATGAAASDATNTTSAVSFGCGFEIAVTARGGGVETLALYAGVESAGVTFAAAAVNVTARVAGGSAPFALMLQSVAPSKYARAGDKADAVFHVSWDAPKGAQVVLSWARAAATAAPTPAPARAYTYTEHAGLSCGTARGDSQPAATAAACEAVCDADDECSCALFTNATRQCQRRAVCEVAKCVPSPADALVKQYELHAGKNCYKGHGVSARGSRACTCGMCARASERASERVMFLRMCACVASRYGPARACVVHACSFGILARR
jgi:formylglycine-generating enzyme required for sulfatase activity